MNMLRNNERDKDIFRDCSDRFFHLPTSQGICSVLNAHPTEQYFPGETGFRARFDKFFKGPVRGKMWRFKSVEMVFDLHSVEEQGAAINTPSKDWFHFSKLRALM